MDDLQDPEEFDEVMENETIKEMLKEHPLLGSSSETESTSIDTESVAFKLKEAFRRLFPPW